jgi:hypothetical protein
MLLTLLKNTNLALAFLLELGVLVAWGYWGFAIGPTLFAKIGFGLGIPVIAIVVWGLFGAPGSDRQLQGLWFLLLQIIFFGSAAIALFTANQRVLGIIFALLFVLNCVLAYIWGQ